MALPIKGKPESLRFLKTPEPPPDPSGVIMGHGVSGGRGYEFVPRDSYEIPEQTKRRLEQESLISNLQEDPMWRIRQRQTEFGDPAGAMFPVSAATKTPVEGAGYGVPYNYSPLDPGYVPPPRRKLKFPSPVKRKQ